METTERVARSAGIVGLGIGTSRILGYLRDMLLASRFGAGSVTDAFLVVFMIPNLLRNRAIGAAAYQVNGLICRTLAWTISPGWVSCLYLAGRLIQLPVSLFGVSLSMALFPVLARYAEAKGG